MHEQKPPGDKGLPNHDHQPDPGRPDKAAAAEVRRRSWRRRANVRTTSFRPALRPPQAHA